MSYNPDRPVTGPAEVDGRLVNLARAHLVVEFDPSDGTCRLVKSRYGADAIPAAVSRSVVTGRRTAAGRIVLFFTDAGVAAEQTRQERSPAQVAGLLAAVSQWVDDHLAGRDPEAIEWQRVAKVAEEAGEVVKALVAYSGGNPRKGVCGTSEEVDTELLDTAICALAAYEHRTGNRGLALAAMFEHIVTRAQRANIEVPS